MQVQQQIGSRLQAIIHLCGVILSHAWRSKKQNLVARSSAEAEFRSLANGICEVLWVQHVLKELKREVRMPIRLYCDNKVAISIAHNPV